MRKLTYDQFLTINSHIKVMAQEIERYRQDVLCGPHDQNSTITKEVLSWGITQSIRVMHDSIRNDGLENGPV